MHILSIRKNVTRNQDVKQHHVTVKAFDHGGWLIEKASSL